MKDNFILNIDELIQYSKKTNLAELDFDNSLQQLELLFMLICSASYAGQYDLAKRPKKVLNKQIYLALQLILPLHHHNLLTKQEFVYLCDCTFANEKFDRLYFDSLRY